MPRAKKPTIDDIARLAGVSKATVSRVLNHKPDVDPATRERVLRVVSEQGYVPSITAAGLAGGRSRLIGALIPSFTWSFTADIMQGVAEVIGDTPYELVLYNINGSVQDNDKGEIIDHILATKLVAGLLAIFPGQTSQHVQRLYKNGFPVVVVDDQIRHSGIPWVGSDNRSGAYTAVRHLLALGHHRIAHLRGPEQYLCSFERYKGYCQALQEAGITPNPELVIECDFTVTAGKIAASKLFELPVEIRPTAIFAASDQIASGVLIAAEEYGLCVPGNLALVGFDDNSLMGHTRPALTTVSQPFSAMGRCGMELLLSMLDVPLYPSRGGSHPVPGTLTRISSMPVGEGVIEDDDAMQILLPTRLIVRASCGSPYLQHQQVTKSGLSL